MSALSNTPVRLAVGFLSGAVIALADNVAFEGEVSPIVIVVLLLAATATFGGVWGRGGWLAAAFTWAVIPLVHLIKHLLGLPDTLQPNTYASILYLAVFTLVIASIGTTAGVVIHRFRVQGGKA
ncbi:MAG: hypothetical protein JNL09_06790 [Anaerolineales bacterium]|nr:hypothetical protein [Anaerolineales bacterium]